MQRFAAAAKHICLWLACLGFLAGIYSPAVAADSEVKAIVCDAGGAQVMITAPRSDIVTTQPSVELRGSTTQASQVDIFIDDNYNNTVSIPSGKNSFSSELRLATGTQTIKVVANDTCQIASASDTIVLTYQPPAPPSPDPQQPRPGVPVAPRTFMPPETVVNGPAASDAPASPPAVVVPQLFMPLLAPLRALDFIAKDGTIPDKAAAIHVVTATAACALLLYGWPGLVNRFLNLGVAAAIPLSPQRAFRYGQWALRLLAILLLAAVFWH